MAGKLFIRILADVSQKGTGFLWQGAYYDTLGQPVAHQEEPSTLEALSDFAQSHLTPETRLIVIVPGENVLLTAVKAPTRQARQLRQAAPYLVEEQLAEDLDALQIAVAPPTGKDSKAALACVQRNLLQSWLDRLQQVELRPHIMLPDTLLTPRPASGWGMVLSEHRALVRSASLLGFSIEQEALLLALEIQTQEQTTDEAALELDCRVPEALGEKHKLLLAELQTLYPQMRVTRTAESEFALLCQTFLKEARRLERLNLLQGDFQPRHQSQRTRSAWRGVAILAGIWLVLHSGFMFYQGHVYDQQAAQLRQQAESLYRSLFPQHKRMVNLKVQMQNELRKGAGDTGTAGVLPLLLAAGEALKEAKLGDDVVIRRFSYNEFQGDLALELTAKAFSDLDEYRSQMVAAGYAAEINGVSNDKQGVKANMQVTGGTR